MSAVELPALTGAEVAGQVVGLPVLRDDVLYDASTAGQYIGRNALWMKRAARAGEIPALQVGRFWKWNAAQIRSIIAGEPYKPPRKRR